MRVSAQDDRADDGRGGLKDRYAGIAGGECAFACYGWRKLRWRKVRPGLAVVRDQEFEFQLAFFVASLIGDGIAEDYAVGRIPENHGVEEGFGIWVGELELPMAAAVGGVVDAGLVAGAGGH
jgi:hypothetical protein